MQSTVDRPLRVNFTIFIGLCGKEGSDAHLGFGTARPGDADATDEFNGVLSVANFKAVYIGAAKSLPGLFIPNAEQGINVEITLNSVVYGCNRDDSGRCNCCKQGDSCMDQWAIDVLRLH